MNFLEGFSKNHQMSNIMKIHPVEAELLHSVRQTGMTELLLFEIF